VVGRLIQQQQSGGRKQRPGQSHTHTPATWSTGPSHTSAQLRPQVNRPPSRTPGVAMYQAECSRRLASSICGSCPGMA
jgi:hypothetical protein